jgi:hypothetical protein
MKIIKDSRKVAGTFTKEDNVPRLQRQSMRLTLTTFHILPIFGTVTISLSYAQYVSPVIHLPIYQPKSGFTSLRGNHEYVLC